MRLTEKFKRYLARVKLAKKCYFTEFIQRQSSNIIVILFYTIFALFFVRGVIFSPGIIVGGDWSFPLSISQTWRFAQSGFYLWSDRSLVGIPQFFISFVPLYLVFALLAAIGITGVLVSKALLVLAFVFPAFTMYLFCRFLGCDKKISFFSGFLYFTLPFFFDSVAMGWLFILFSMGVLPLALMAFIKSVKENRIGYAVLAGFLYYIGMLQSQALVWYPLAFLFFSVFLIEGKKDLIRYLKSLLIIFLIFLGMTAVIYLPMFFSSNDGALKTSFVLAPVSLGTWARLNYLNILRAWGSVFNYQYETGYIRLLTPLSLLLPLVAYSSLLFLRKRKVIYPFILLSLVPLALFKLGPGLIARIPFSDIIRNIARFLILSSFSYVVLSCLVLNFFWRRRNLFLKSLVILICLGFVMAAYPFFKGELYGEPKQGYDVRLRNYQYPQDYFSAEQFLSREKRDFKVMYLTVGGSFRVLNDKRFDGDFETIRDIFSAFSVKSSDVGSSGGETGSTAEVIGKFNAMQEVLKFDNLPMILNSFAAKYIVVRKDALFKSSPPVSGENVALLLKSIPGLALKNESEKIALFENQSFLPHIHTTSKIVVSNDEPLDAFFKLAYDLDEAHRSAIYFEKQNENRLQEIVAKDKSIYLASAILAQDIPLLNSSFEDGLWRESPLDCTNGRPGKAELAMGLAKDATDGQKSLELSSKNHHACTFQDFYIKLQPKHTYRLSFDYKNIKGGKVDYSYTLFGDTKNFSGGDSIIATSSGWHHIDKFFIPEINIKKVALNLYAPSDGDEVVNRFDNVKLSLMQPELSLLSKSKEEIKTPFIEYKKISPVKYRLIIHQAKENFPLIFSEGFHVGWKVYPTKPVYARSSLFYLKEELKSRLADYKIFEGNETDQANKDELAGFIEQGWISTLGDSKEKQLIYKNFLENGKETVDRIEKYKIDFISKNFQDTLQNNNLPNGNIWETWFRKPLSEANHLIVNGYANSWWIRLDEIEQSGIYLKNPDGSLDFELLIEFQPQRLFYLGILIAFLTLLVCFGGLIYFWLKHRK